MQQNHRMSGPVIHTPYAIHHTSLKAFTLLETMMVITIIAILFMALEPTYQAFQVKAQLTDATDRTRQILERAKTLALSGYRTPGTDPDLLVVEVNRSNPPDGQIRLCSQKFDPSKTPTISDIHACTNPSLIIDSVPLGSIRIASPTGSSLAAFVPPFGSSVTATGNLEIILRVGDSPTARTSTVHLASSTNRIEVNPPSPTP